MKTKYLKIDWLVPLLGIAVVAAGVAAGTTYLGIERKINASETLTATLDRLYQDQRLSAALKTIHDGEANAAARRLDLLLCEHILRTNSELASADPQTRAYVEDAFRRIARLRPKTEGGAAGSSTQECNEDQLAAQRILELALAGDRNTQSK